MEARTTSGQHQINAAFKRKLERCRRINYQRKVFYHPVDDIKSWMLENSSESGASNAGLLLHYSYANAASTFAPTKPEDIANALLVFAILLQLDHGHLIHVFQQVLNDDSLDADLRKDDLLNELKRSNLRYTPDILEQFERERWRFCPAKIEDMCHHTKAYYGGRWILPFCRRQMVGEGGTAFVYGVLVQADIVPDNLKNEALQGYGYKDPEFGDCFQLAVKTYQDKDHDVFQTERDNFSGIHKVPGVVKYLGWYKFDEKDHPTDPQTTHNILLEYGEQDLDEYLALRYPPVLNSEIINFWENIFGVATTLKAIHNLEYEGPGGLTTPFIGWHGDIKPSNILLAQGQFKLADFGFTKFEPSRDGADQRTELLGVTHTYGAPECDPGRLRRPTKTEHGQVIDTWSLGCVFSGVATWVVLGSFAYHQYPHVRKLAISDLLNERRARQDFEGPKADDSFHDGRNVLQAVKSWHKYLLSSMRKSDTITGQVLKFVEDHMLLPDPKDRMPSARLVSELEDIIATARTLYDQALKRHDVPRIPPETLKALLTLDDLAPAGFGLKAEPSEPKAQHLGSSLDPPRTIRVGKSERVEGMVIQAKVAGRRQVLANELDKLDEPYTPPPVSFIPGKAGPASNAQRQFEAPPALPPRQTTPPPVIVTSDETPMLVMSPQQVDYEDRVDKGKRPMVPNPPNPGAAASQDNVFSGRGSDINLAAHATLNQASSSSSDRRKPRVNAFGITDHPPSSVDVRPARDRAFAQENNPSPVSVGPRQSVAQRSTLTNISEVDDWPMYKIGQLRFELDLQWSQQGVFAWRKLVNKAPSDNGLKDFIKDRDIVFLVDNCWSMRQHWTRAKFVLETLGMKIGPLDEDGLDLLFTRGCDNYKEGVKGFEIPTKFSDAMRFAKAGDNPALYQTNMTQILSDVLSKYCRNMTKKLTVIVLTTGEWEAQENGQADLEEVLAKYIKVISQARQDFRRERVCTIQFISFGDNEKALQRLRDLDDKLSKDFDIPDVIDTEPWTGDPQKMLLGSIYQSLDRQPSGIDHFARYQIGEGPAGDPRGYQPRSDSQPPTPPVDPRRSTNSLSSKVSRIFQGRNAN